MKENIELAKQLCEKYLNTKLVPSNSHDDAEGCFMTEDETFYFSPDESYPVTVCRLGGECPIPGRFYFNIETVKCFPGSFMEPDDYDLVEVGRGNSLVDAVKQAILLNKEWDIDGFLQNEAEAQMEIESRKYFDQMEQSKEMIYEEN